MYTPYRTCAVMLHPVALPTDLFQVSALCAGKSFDYNYGTGFFQKLKQLFWSTKEKQNAYVQQILKSVPKNPQHLIPEEWYMNDFDELTFEDTKNNRYEFVYDNNQQFIIRQKEYHDIHQYVAIQPNDIILNFYYFPQLDQFVQLIPQAVALWTEHDVRVSEMKKTAEIATQANFALQSMAVIRSVPTDAELESVLQSELKLNYHYKLEPLPQGFFHYQLGTNDTFLSSKELQHIYKHIYNQLSQEMITFCDMFEKPLLKDADWMSQLRVRDNHFRSDYDIYNRVQLPLANWCKDQYIHDWINFKRTNRLSYIDPLFAKVFVLTSDADIIKTRGILIIHKTIIPVFIDEYLSHDIRLGNYNNELYGLVGTTYNKIQKLRQQPFRGKNINQLKYLHLHTEGISVVSFDGTEHLRVTYAKLTEKMLADIIRVITEAA